MKDAVHTTTLRKVGGSIMLAVPPALLDILRLQSGARVGVAVESGRLVVEPQRRPRYTLKELLAQCNPKAPRSKQDREWLDAKPVGGESALMRRGEIWLVALDPTHGHEQKGLRPVLIVSPEAFNRVTKLPVAVPITSGGSFARTAGFAVTLQGAGTRTGGVVRCDQPRVLDIRALGGKKLESIPEAIMNEVLAKLLPIFE